MSTSSTRAFLERRNALWLTLRRCGPLEAQADATLFEQTLPELSRLIGWSRPQILAGLGLSEAEVQESWPPQP